MKRLTIGKKGSEHVEVILSFIIFVGFVLFLLNYLQPYKKDILPNSILTGVKDSFFQNASIELTSVLVKNVSTTDYCAPSEVSGPSMTLDTSNESFYYVLASSEFNSSLLACATSSYLLGYLSRESVLSNSSLVMLRQKYQNDYDNLKLQLFVPASVDFSISSNGYNLEREIPENIPVNSVIYRKDVIYSNGTVESKEFIFKVW